MVAISGNTIGQRPTISVRPSPHAAPHTHAPIATWKATSMKGSIALELDSRAPSGTGLRLIIAILTIITAANLLVPFFIAGPSQVPVFAKDVGSHEIYGHVPPQLDVVLQNVAMTVEDSINFQLDTEPGAAQWAALLPKGGGIVSMGEGATRKQYRPAMFHALSCLDTIRQGVLARKADRTVPTTPEVHLCLDYIRQTVQCRSDIQLEQVRSEYGGKSVQPFVTHTNCRDWRQLYEEAERLNAQDELGVDQ